jgi:lysyl-tRNA synthetase class 2
MWTPNLLSRHEVSDLARHRRHIRKEPYPVLNPEQLLPLRHRFVRTLRSWFDNNGFCEVETPQCVRSPGMEPHLLAFEATAKEAPASHRHVYLHTSPEYHMKRVLATFKAPIYQICRCFRDEQASRLHHPEFTMLEWYRPDADYKALMSDCEGLLEQLAADLLGQAHLDLTDGRIDLSAPFEKLSVSGAFERHAGFDPLDHESPDALRATAIRAGLDVPSHWSWEDIFHFTLLERVEQNLGRAHPTILFGYPPSLAALSRVVDGRAERFELYIAGHELANAFSELVDPDEQRARFIEEQAERRRLDRPVYPIDEALLDALSKIPRAAGIALGVDRLWLLFAEHFLQRRIGLIDALWLSL